MSLINQALKKEQMTRTGMVAGTPLPPHAQSIARQHARSSNRNTILLVGLVGFGGFTVVCLATFIYFGSKALDKMGQTEFASAPSAEISESSVASAPASLASGPIAKAKEAIAAVEETQAPLEEVMAMTEKTLAIPEPPATEVAQAEPPLAKAPVDEFGFNPAVQTFVDNLAIQGIRAAGTKSRLLANGKVFRLGDLIDRKLGIVFKQAKSGVLIFEDRSGSLYERSL